MHADLCDDRFEQRATATTFSGHPKDCILDTGPEGCHTFVIGFGHPLNANDLSMDDLVCCIENWTDHPLMNRANLRGPFSYATAGLVDFSSLPTIFTVLGKLGRFSCHCRSIPDDEGVDGGRFRFGPSISGPPVIRAGRGNRFAPDIRDFCRPAWRRTAPGQPPG
jgi:hypothetical protein